MQYRTVLYCAFRYVIAEDWRLTDGAVVQDTSVQGDVREIRETRNDGGGNNIMYRTVMSLSALDNMAVPGVRYHFFRGSISRWETLKLKHKP